jgi:hypothetical protein
MDFSNVEKSLYGVYLLPPHHLTDLSFTRADPFQYVYIQIWRHEIAAYQSIGSTKEDRHT